MKTMKAKTWKDILMLRMTWMEKLQFYLFLAWSTTAGVTFATLFEEGSPMTPLMEVLYVIFYLLFLALSFVLAFDIFVKPRLCPSSATAPRTTSVSNSNDNPLFGINQIGAGSAMGM